MVLPGKKAYLLLFSFLCYIIYANASKSLVESISDSKEFKKILRSKSNVLVAFTNNADTTSTKVLHNLSSRIRGIGTVVIVNCTTAEKLCKKQKVKGLEAITIKHFMSGEYHKDYDRPHTLKSMETFMREPKGEMPWHEEENARHIVHIFGSKHFTDTIKRNAKNLVMFYAPWCGFCKKMKPDFTRAATDAKVEGIGLLVAVDATSQVNRALSEEHNITGFPTLLFFQNGGDVSYTYPGKNNYESLMSFMRNPSEEMMALTAESNDDADNKMNWSDETSHVVHLTDATFDSFVADNPSVLIMFYAPWCGHCKRMKPHFVAASERLNATGQLGVLAAVDCTEETVLARRFVIKGYPTLKYFEKGEFLFEASQVRNEEDIIAFMTDPKPPPPPEIPWAETESSVVHLTEENFKKVLKKKKHVLVMFYAPWCGHCKRSKPEYIEAADKMSDNSQLLFSAVDCTVHVSLCQNISGYPTFIYFRYYDKAPPRLYKGARKTADFISFMEIQGSPWESDLGHVRLLDESNFHSVLTTVQHSLVVFYAPLCDQCNKMRTHYVLAAEELHLMNKESASVVLLAAVDGNQQKRVSRHYSVSGYPTIMYFRNGVLSGEYKGERTKDSFVGYLRSKMEKTEL